MGSTCCHQQEPPAIQEDAASSSRLTGASKGEKLLKKVFNIIDSDHNGKVDVKELNIALRSNEELQEMFKVRETNYSNNQKGPPPPGFFAALIKKYDADGDGKISYDEFVKYFLPQLDGHEDPLEAWSTLWGVFNEIDADHNGKISLNELGAAMRNSPEIKNNFTGGMDIVPSGLLKEFDTNGDGQISWEEFTQHFRRRNKASNPDDVRGFLESLGLGKYADKMIEEEYDSVKMLNNMDTYDSTFHEMVAHVGMKAGAAEKLKQNLRKNKAAEYLKSHEDDE